MAGGAAASTAVGAGALQWGEHRHPNIQLVLHWLLALMVLCNCSCAKILPSPFSLVAWRQQRPGQGLAGPSRKQLFRSASQANTKSVGSPITRHHANVPLIQGLNFFAQNYTSLRLRLWTNPCLPKALLKHSSEIVARPEEIHCEDTPELDYCQAGTESAPNKKGLFWKRTHCPRQLSTIICSGAVQ